MRPQIKHMPTLPKAKRPPWKPECKESSWSVSDNYKIYNGTKWRSLALAHKRQNPLCAVCLERGIVTPVAVTDHVKAIKDGGRIYDWENLQSLCKPCHMDKTNKETKDRKNG